MNWTELLPAVLPPLVVALSAGALAILAFGYPRAVAAAAPRAGARGGAGPAPEHSTHAVPAAPAPRPAPPRADLRGGLRKSRFALVGRIEALLRGRPALDAATLGEVEEILFSADIGVRTADDLLEAARGADSPGAVRAALEARALEILRGLPSAVVPMTARPHVLLVVGVNGSGKTTTIGKLAARCDRRGQEGRPRRGRHVPRRRDRAAHDLGAARRRADRERPSGRATRPPWRSTRCKSAQGRRRRRLIIDTAGRLHTKARPDGRAQARSAA